MAFDSDIDYDPKCKGRVLFDGAFGTEGHLRTKSTIIYFCRTAMQMEQWFSARDKVTNAGDEFDDAVSTLCQSHECLCIRGKNDC
jgi:hypothetical protein